MLPNLKGVCNRLQLFSGLYILSAFNNVSVVSISFAIIS